MVRFAAEKINSYNHLYFLLVIVNDLIQPAMLNGKRLAIDLIFPRR